MDKDRDGAEESAELDTGGLTLPPCEGLPREVLDTGLPEHVFERMDFLWRASQCLRVSSPVLARIYSDQLRALCEEQQDVGDSGLLPEWIRESMCGDCGGVLTPGINCRVRVRHRSLKSPSVKKAMASKRLKKCRNEIVTTCLLCGKANVRGGTERRTHHRNRRKAVGGSGPDGATKDYATPNARTRVANNLRGNFIPLGTSGPPAPSSTTTTTTTTPRRRPPRSNRQRGDTQQQPQQQQQLQKKRGNFPATAEAGSKHADGGGNNKRRGAGGAVAGVGAVHSLLSPRDSRNIAGRKGVGVGVGDDRGIRTPLSHPASAIGGGSSSSISGGASQRGGVTEPPGEPRSLLETIKKEAKRKRRQEAAAAAAAAASGSGGIGR